MSQLKQKIGQMLILGFEGDAIEPHDAIAQAILHHAIGGVILFDYNYRNKSYDKNIKNPQQVKSLTQQLQAYTKQAATAQRTPYLPLIISVDYEGGKVNRLKQDKGFPNTESAASFEELGVELVKQHAERMAATLQHLGINLNFAPDIDVNVNPDNPIIGSLDRSFSADPKIVTEFAAIFSKAFQQHQVLCAYKHFPGHGSATADSHLGFVDISETWQSCELQTFRELLSHPQQADFVMTAHLVNRQLDTSGLPATLSKAMLTGILRDQLNFKGVIVTDDMQMKAISEEYGLEDALVKSINAGADMLIFGNQLVPSPQDPAVIIDIIASNVQADRIAESRIDDAYRRIVAAKTKLIN